MGAGRTATGQGTSQATPSSRASRAQRAGGGGHFDPTVSEAPVNKPASSSTREGKRKKKRSPWSKASRSSPPGVLWPAREGPEPSPGISIDKRNGNDKSYANMSPLWARCASRSLVCRVFGDAGRTMLRVKRPTRTKTYLWTCYCNCLVPRLATAQTCEMSSRLPTPRAVEPTGAGRFMQCSTQCQGVTRSYHSFGLSAFFVSMS